MINEPWSFDGLKEWLSAKPSVAGKANERVYTEIFSAHLARPGDEKFAESIVSNMIAYQVQRLGNGLIHWRINLETEIKDEPQIIEFCDDGEDIDFLTKQKCRKDHNWKIVKAYCRLAVDK